MTLTEFIAEIESKFSTYVDSGDVDEISIKLDVIECLKQFGANIQTVEEDVLQVRNSKAFLPDTFRSLRLALLLEPFGCVPKQDKQTNEYVYYERIENGAYYDDISQEYVTTCDPKIVTEKITVNTPHADYCYNYDWLSLRKGINKKNLATDCYNIHPSIRNSYPNEISITRNTINTNFSEGTIYIQYKSLPTDEDGDIVIPDMTTGDLLRYVENYCKVNIAERLIQNNKNPQGLTQLYNKWVQEQPMLRRAALVESKFYGLEKDWHKRLKDLNRRDIKVFRLPSLKFYR